MHFSSFLATAAFLLPFTTAAGLYTKSSPVLEVDARSYDRLIARSNYTSIVEFYAPWCGHCQNLKPAYEKAATALSGIARVAAINCDEDENKGFCGTMGVQGFPTLKIVKPGRSKDGKKAKAIVEDYQGARTAKGINDAVVGNVVNHVTKLKDDSVDAWAHKEPSKPKALFFSEKGLVSPLIKAVAIDFLEAVDVGFIRSAEKAAVEKYGVKGFPTIVLLQGDDKEPILYNGEMKKPALVEFISQAAPPNPDADPAKLQQEKPKQNKSKKARDPLGAPTKIPKASPSSSASTKAQEPSSSPDVSSPPGDAVKPAPQIPSLSSESDLQKSCLHTKSTICILAILPADDPDSFNLDTSPAISALNDISHKHKSRGANIFPFYIVPSATNNLAQHLITELLAQSPPASGGDEQVNLLAINAKRGWWTRYEGVGHTASGIEDWIDNIRFGEHEKKTLPEGLVQEIQMEEAPKKAPKKAEPVPPVEEEEAPIPISFEQMEGMPSGEFGNGLKWEWVEVDDDYVPEQERVKDEL